MAEVKSRRQEYADLTRQAVLDAATALFAEQGYGATSLDQVAAAARVSKGTVYAHFEGKQALFTAALVDLERALHEELTALMAGYDDLWEASVAALSAFFDACCDPLYGRVVMREGPIALSFAEFFGATEEYSYGLVRTLLATLIDAGEVAPLPVETASRISHGILGTAAVLIADTQGEQQVVARQEAEAVVLALIQGLRIRPSAP